jgi:hypothetical protein
MSVARSPNGDYLGLKCDTCEKPSPPTDEIMRAFGLSRMGWHCSGGTHICPGCPQPAPTQGSLVGVR